MTNRISTQKAHTAVEKRVPFKTHGAMRGEYTTWPSAGSMPEPFRSQFQADVKALRESDGSVYVVFSYETPIAWYVPEVGWNRPSVKYSVTTSRHQGQCPISGTV